MKIICKINLLDSKVNKSFIKILLLLSLLTIIGCENNVSNTDDNTVSAVDTYKQIIKEVGITQASGLGDVCNKYFSDDMSRENFLRVFVERIRIQSDPSIYVFIYDTNFVSIAHPVLKNYIGQNHYDDKDTKGQYISHIIQDTLRKSGEGFVEFYFDNPATKKNEKKTTFVKKIKNTKYLLGIGFYGESLDKTDYEKAEVNRLIVKNCVNTTVTGFGDVFAAMIQSDTDKIRFIRNYNDSTRFLKDLSGYFFVDDMSGKSISYPVRKDLEDSLLTDIKDFNGVHPVVEMLKVINTSGSGYVEYHLENPVTKEVQKKIVYVEKIPNTNYFLGCGYYGE